MIRCYNYRGEEENYNNHDDASRIPVYAYGIPTNHQNETNNEPHNVGGGNKFPHDLPS